MVKIFMIKTIITIKNLYEQAHQLPNVNYIGYKPNSYIKDNLHNIICMFIQVYLKKRFVYLY